MEKNIISLSINEALIIGLCQSLAVIPGVSRAGVVLVTMILMGFKHDESAVYSFLLAVPTILAASFFDLYKMRDIVFVSQSNLFYLTVGFLTAFVFAYISVKWLIEYLQKKSLNIFGIYRIVGGAVVLLMLF